MKVTVCFFGITRSLRYTHDSIVKNILSPLKKHSEFNVCAHFYDLEKVLSVRSGENSDVDRNEFRLLDADYLLLEKPDKRNFPAEVKVIKRFGDSWGNKFQSFDNLIYQLRSLKAATEYAEHLDSDICLFLRPDLLYHDSFSGVLDEVFSEKNGGNENNIVFLPEWQSWSGLNDRFAICVGSKAIKIYGNRLDKMLEFCAYSGRPLHSERLLKYCFKDAGVKIQRIPLRASRVRADGVVKKESFTK